MKISSQVFKNNELIGAKYTCDGDNVSPPLQIAGVPENARSLVLIMDDPDAVTGYWLHWTVWNILPDTKVIFENSVPAGAVEGATDFGWSGYGGPCPPSGTHRYFFKLYALNRVLRLSAGASLDELKQAMKNSIMDKAELIGLYKRG